MATFYRIVQTNPPTVVDFLSGFDRGEQPPRRDPEAVRLWDGISVYATAPQARRTARKFSRLGSCLAQLDIPDDAPLRIERTRHHRGHHTIWGDPAYLLGCVAAVVPIEGGD